MGDKGYKTKLILDYVERHREELEIGTIGKKTLAKIIWRENRDAFADDEQTEVERIRATIRYLTGTIGKFNRHKRSMSIENPDHSQVTKNGMKPSEYAPPEDYEMQYAGRTLIVSDVHLPYHDLDALTAAIEYGLQKEVVSIVINGDLMDMFELSKWLKPTKGTPQIAEELESTREFFGWLRSMFKGKIVYKLGNHEDRWEHYFWRKAEAFQGVFKLDKVLGLDKFGVDMVQSRQKIKLGKLNVLHGHEFGSSVFSPVNPARGVFLRAKASTLVGHSHQTSEHTEGDINGERTACYSTGCLCTLQPEYRPFAYTKWNHGFAVVQTDSEGNFMVDNRKIENGLIV